MKKVLFVCLHNPYLSTTGAHQRSNNILCSLKSMAKVDVLIFDIIGEKKTINKEDRIYYYDISNKCKKTKKEKRKSQIVKCLNFFSTKSILACDTFCKSKYIEILKSETYDYIFFRYIDSYLICGSKGSKKILIDIDDAPWQNSKIMSKNTNYSATKRIFHYYTYKLVKFHASKILKKVTCSFFSNINDCILNNSVYLPNIPYTKGLIPSKNLIDNQNVVFIGSLSHVPNAEGLDYFIKNIWHLVVAKIPKAKLYIVGKGLSEEKKQRWENIESIEILGFIDNLSDIYNKCAIAIAPVYSGAGTNIKVLEALFMNKVCIVSAFAIRGYEHLFNDSKEIFVAQSDEDYISKLSYAMNHIGTKEFQEMASRGKKIVDENFTLASVERSLYPVLFQNPK